MNRKNRGYKTIRIGSGACGKAGEADKEETL